MAAKRPSRTTVELSLAKLAGLVALVGTLASALWAASFWVWRVDADVAKTPPIESALELLTQQQAMERELWGANYRQRIAEVLKRETPATWRAARERAEAEAAGAAE